MSEWFLFAAALYGAAAFVLGMYVADHFARDMWRKHGYCPTCDRLTTDQETR